jgi:ABC transporter substrate binding protein
VRASRSGINGCGGAAGQRERRRRNRARRCGIRRTANGGLVVPNTAPALIYRELIIKLAARYRLPAIYGNRGSVVSGGLVSYEPIRDSYRRVAGYVDRILRGEKPADLPVQAPTRYETVLNLKTAKALGVCTENLNPGVVVMESAQDGERFDAPGPLNCTRVASGGQERGMTMI